MDAILYIQSAKESLENKSQPSVGLPYYVTDVAT